MVYVGATERLGHPNLPHSPYQLRSGLVELGGAALAPGSPRDERPVIDIGTGTSRLPVVL